MPAASDVPQNVPQALPMTLPITWRPLGARVAVVFFGAMLVAVCAFAWFGFDPEIRAKFTLLQRGTILFIGALYVAVGYALARSRVVASAEGLRVVNGYKQHHYEWAEVVAVRLPPGAPWATLDLADGTTASMLGIQSTDGERAGNAVRTLRALTDR